MPKGGGGCTVDSLVCIGLKQKQGRALTRGVKCVSPRILGACHVFYAGVSVLGHADGDLWWGKVFPLPLFRLLFMHLCAHNNAGWGFWGMSLFCMRARPPPPPILTWTITRQASETLPTPAL